MSGTAVLTILSALLVGGKGAPPPTPVETRREFGAACRRIRESSVSLYGRAPLEKLRAQFSQPSFDPSANAAVRVLLSREHLKQGESAEAVRLLTEARKIVESRNLGRDHWLDVTFQLGLAQMRVGEQSNCVGMHRPASCILPIRGDGVHRETGGSKAAEGLFLDFLREKPDDRKARWLLNVAAMTVGDYPDRVPKEFRIPPSTFTSEQSVGTFSDVAPQLGLDVFDSSGGAIMEDFDNDGFLDIVTSTIDPCKSMHYFHNRGDGTFADWTASSGLDGQLGGLNIIQADYDNDGWTDILVLRGGWMGPSGQRRSLLHNNGDGTFSDVTRTAGLAATSYPSQTAAWGDYDNDGWLDLYVGNESDEKANLRYPAQLYHNNGNGTFTEVASRAGVTNDRFAKSVVWGDYDNDGWPDLYVSNLGPNRLYRNNGDGTFTDVAEILDVTEPRGWSFPAFFFDYDNDGWLDLFVSDYGSDEVSDVFAFYEGLPHRDVHPRLYHNDHGRFTEVSKPMGLGSPVLPMAANFGDLDNDGWPDFYLGTGFPEYDALMPNVMYRNDEGKRFVDVTFSSGTGHLQKGHGIAWGDIDNDGNQDIYEQMGGAYPGDAYRNVLYLNPGHPNHWITLLLRGTRSNRSAIGARIRVEIETPEGKRDVFAVVGTGGSFGGNSLQQEMGLGSAAEILDVEVTWPRDNRIEHFRNLAPDGFFELVEGEGIARLQNRVAIRLAGVIASR